MFSALSLPLPPSQSIKLQNGARSRTMEIHDSQPIDYGWHTMNDEERTQSLFIPQCTQKTFRAETQIIHNASVLPAQLVRFHGPSTLCDWCQCSYSGYHVLRAEKTFLTACRLWAFHLVGNTMTERIVRFHGPSTYWCGLVQICSKMTSFHILLDTIVYKGRKDKNLMRCTPSSIIWPFLSAFLGEIPKTDNKGSVSIANLP